MAGKNILDLRTHSITYQGSSELTKADHTHMPSRTFAYLDTDERGHIQASSLSGSNNRLNIVPQAKDLNHGAYYRMEQAERGFLRSGSIESEKTAFVSNQPGYRPDAFIVNDEITFADGQTQTVHLSFSNLTNAQQEGMNMESGSQAASMFDAYDNPGDTLRESMSSADYASLMEETDASLPGIQEMYTEHNTLDPSGLDSASWGFDATTEASADASGAWSYACEGEAEGGSIADSAEADTSADID